MAATTAAEAEEHAASRTGRSATSQTPPIDAEDAAPTMNAEPAACGWRCAEGEHEEEAARPRSRSASIAGAEERRDRAAEAEDVCVPSPSDRMRAAEEHRDRADGERRRGDGRRGQDAGAAASADRGVDRIAAQDRVERGQPLAPALARVALADRPGEEHQHGHRQVVEEELEAAMRERGLLRVDACPMPVPSRTSPARRSDRTTIDSSTIAPNRNDAVPHADFAGVVLLEEDHQQDEQQRRRARRSCSERAADLDPSPRNCVPSAYSSIEHPSRRTIADEVDPEVHHHVAGGEVERDAIAERPVGAARRTFGRAARNCGRRAGQACASAMKRPPRGRSCASVSAAPASSAADAAARAEDLARAPLDVDVAVRGELLELAAVVSDAIAAQARTDDRDRRRRAP